MRMSKALGSLVVASVAIGLLTASTESRAGDEELLTVSCSNGDVSVTPKAPWHANEKAPWKWDKGGKITVDAHGAKAKGDKCEGTIKAYICNGDQCKGPIPVPVK